MIHGHGAGVTELLPRWVAPNLITMTGMVGLILSYFLFLVYLTRLEGTYPPFVHQQLQPSLLFCRHHEPESLACIALWLMPDQRSARIEADAPSAGDAPRWVFFSGGLAVLIYLHLDCVDGKQARRTGSSSPLGQLFDHGAPLLPPCSVPHSRQPNAVQGLGQ